MRGQAALRSDFSSLGNYFLTSSISHASGRITLAVEVKKMFPSSPSERDTKVFLLWEEQGQNDLLLSASPSLPKAGHTVMSQEVGKVIYVFTTSLVS